MRRQHVKQKSITDPFIFRLINTKKIFQTLQTYLMVQIQQQNQYKFSIKERETKLTLSTYLKREVKKI